MTACPWVKDLMNKKENVMSIQRLCLVYFSPTNTTKKVLQLVSKACFTRLEVIEYDLTDYAMRKSEIEFSESDFVIFGIPVYSGRVPKVMVERLKNITGNKTQMAMIATYGNREYNDALLELKELMEPKGFIAIGAAAIVTEHSVVRSIAKGRPNEEDKKVILDFGQALNNIIYHPENILPNTDLKINGNFPYRKYMEIPMAPKTTSKCNKCKACAKMCPVRAINMEDVRVTDKRACIGCMRCVRNCPQKARTVGKVKTIGANIIMTVMCRTEKKSEIFLMERLK